MANNNGSLTRSLVVEFSIIAVLVLLISGVLNYFNVLPLSETFPALSFLPRQSSNTNVRINTPTNNTNIVNKSIKRSFPARINVVNPTTPLVTENTGVKQSKIELIDKSFVKTNSFSTWDLIIDLSLETKPNSLRSGILLGDNLKDKNSKRLLVGYSPKDKSWSLQYTKGDEKKYIELSKNSNSKINLKITLKIINSGKAIVVILPDGSKKSMLIPESLFESSGTIHAVTQVAPSSKLTINNLNYSLNK